MSLLKSFVLATLMMLAAPVLAQTAALPADSAAAVPDVPELAPAPAGMGEREKCKQSMGGTMTDGGMACCKGKQGGAGKMGCEKCKQGMGGKMADSGMACCKGVQGGAGKMGCEKCAGMGGKMHHGGGKSCCGGIQGGGMGGMGCCGGMHGGGAGDTAALERRVNELEKRLDLLQQLLQQPRKR